jgi:hypothetical protein
MTTDTQTVSPAEDFIRDFRAAGGKISTNDEGTCYGWGASVEASKVHRAAMLANPGDDFERHVRQALEAELA